MPWYHHGREPADPAWGAAYTFLADWVGKYYHDNQVSQPWPRTQSKLQQQKSPLLRAVSGKQLASTCCTPA